MKFSVLLFASCSGTLAMCWRLFSLFIILNVFATEVHSENVDKSKPHIIVMVADDFGWNDIGFRNPDIHSPYLDQLAYSGIILNHSYVQHLCTPSRAALMTGYFPIQTGMQKDVIPLFAPFGLPTHFKLLPQELKELGYNTNLIGKWHLGSCNDDYLPMNRGFENYFGFLGGGQFYYDHGYNLTNNDQPGENVTFAYDFWNQTDPAWDYNGTHSSIPFVMQVERILESWDGHSPLFLYLPFQLTHSPQQVPPGYDLWYPGINNIYRKTFSAMVSALDDDIGKILNILTYHGIYQNSVILFTADNGGEVRNGGNNYPLRGSKYTYWEGGTRASAFIHSPLLKSTGYTYNGLIHAVDWYPTFVSLAGGKPDPNMDGLDVWNAITTNSPSPRTRFVYNLEYINGNLTGAIRVGDWKLIVGKAGLPADVIDAEDVTGEYANSIGHVAPFEDVPGYPPFRLFNITDDPSEELNVANENLNIVHELFSVVVYYRNKMVQPVFRGDDVDDYIRKTSNLTYLNTNWCEPIENVTPMPPVSVEHIINYFLGRNATL